MTKRSEPSTKRRKTTTRVPLDGRGDRPEGNSHLHVRHKPNPLFAPPPFIVETVFFSKVGHTFGAAPSSPGLPPMYVVQDFLLDQTGASGADGKMSNTTLFDLTTATSFRFNLYPKDRAKRIKVVPPASGPVYMGFNVGRRFVNAVSDVSDAYPANSFFVNLLGNSPLFSYNVFFIGRNTNHWIQFWVNADVAEFSFSGFTTIGTYPPRAFDPGVKSYTPFSVTLPFNLPGPNAVPNLVFSYTTSSSSDPGPFVFLA